MFLSHTARKAYPSDLTPPQFEAIRPELKAAIEKTCPRKVDLHEIFHAVAYVVKTGSPWRKIPTICPTGTPPTATFKSGNDSLRLLTMRRRAPWAWLF